jgi:hypothetical protein
MSKIARMWVRGEGREGKKKELIPTLINCSMK